MSSKKNPDAKDTWETPRDLVAAIQAFASHEGFRRVTLDPATTKANPVDAEYIRTDSCDPDGLETEWFSLLSDKPQFVYVNPPYRQPWYKKLVLEAIRMKSTSAPSHMIALLPAKPGAGYFQDIAKGADAVLFIRGRLTFSGASEPAPFESALVYFGPSKHQFRASFQRMGWAV